MADFVTSLRTDLSDTAWDLLIAGLAAAAAIALALAVHALLYRLLRRIATATDSAADDMLVRRLCRPTRWATVALGLVLAARELPLLESGWQKAAGFVMPALVGWIALAVVHGLIQAAELRADITVADNLEARRKRTRLAILSRIATFIVVFVTVGLMLLSIPGVREVGVTLMASAGLAGLAVGAAAQPALKSLIAGVQMALTEPIRIDDVVVIDGEWGRIEDIRTTYVVVRIWDERRLVVPAVRFLEDTFQNWTRQGAEVLGTVFLHLDPLARIDPLRAEFDRFVESHPLWDQRAKSVQVTDAAAESIEVRLLVSGRNSGDVWDLRCAVREHMLGWLRDAAPEAIARRRFETAPPHEEAPA